MPPETLITLSDRIPKPQVPSSELERSHSQTQAQIIYSMFQVLSLSDHTIKPKAPSNLLNVPSSKLERSHS
jgi:hypothetical protein